MNQKTKRVLRLSLFPLAVLLAMPNCGPFSLYKRLAFEEVSSKPITAERNGPMFLRCRYAESKGGPMDVLGGISRMPFRSGDIVEIQTTSSNCGDPPIEAVETKTGIKVVLKHSFPRGNVDPSEVDEAMSEVDRNQLWFRDASLSCDLTAEEVEFGKWFGPRTF